MIVGPQHGVDTAHAGIDQLLAQVWRGVDQKGLALILDQDRAAAAPVLRVGRIASAPVAGAVLAADAWHAARRAAAEDGQAHGMAFMVSLSNHEGVARRPMRASWFARLTMKHCDGAAMKRLLT